MYLSKAFGMTRGFEETDFMSDRGNQLFSDAFAPETFTAKREHHSGIARFQELFEELLDGPVHKNIANALYYKFKTVFPIEADVDDKTYWDDQAIESATEFIHDSVRDGERFFAMVNLMGAHAPWKYDVERLAKIGIDDPTEIAPVETWKEVADKSAKQWEYAAGEIEFDDVERELLQHLYESWVYRVDTRAGDLIEELKPLGVTEDTLVIVTSDHGEMIAKEDVLGHNVTVNDDLTHVPLAIDGPGVSKDNISHPVSLKDIYGTVLERTGVSGNSKTLLDNSGIALAETFGSDEQRIARLNENYLGKESVRDLLETRRAIYTREGRAERRYGTGEVFGPSELIDDLDDRVSQFSQAPKAKQEDLNESVKDRLKKLGYAE